MFKKTLLTAALLSLVGFAATATAATSGSFPVKLTINKACSITTSGALDFGSANADSTTDVSQSTGAINVTCSKTTPYTVGLTPSSASTNGTGTMKGATSGNADTVAYALFQAAGATTPWGNTGAGLKSGTGNGTVQNLTVYGKVLGSNLNVTPDAYADTVAVAITY